jgi:type II secretory pathway pseudopilin PulG
MESGNAVEVGWTAAQTAIVAVAVIALVGAVISASITYWLNQRTARRERRSTVFAEALSAVEEYAEMPYRIRRRLVTAEARYDLCEEVSRLQSRLAFYQTLLQIESPDIAVAYSNLVRAAKIQAGGQMQDAWRQPVLTTDAEMNLSARYPRDQIDAARTNCVVAMQRALGGRYRDVALPLSATSDLPAN